MSNWSVFQNERLKNAEAEIKRLKASVEMYERLDRAHLILAGGTSSVVSLIHEHMDHHSKGGTVPWHIVTRRVLDGLIRFSSECNDARALAIETHFDTMKKL